MNAVGSSTHLYLIRHGQAVTNIAPIIGGMRGDTGLTRLGMAQAERLRDRLAQSKEIIPDVVIASTLPRARQTAEIIAPAFDLPILYDDSVQELRPGEADGLSIEEFEARYGTPDFEHEPLRPMAPGGESWGSFMLRVANALDRLRQEYAGKSIVVVCHGGVIEGAFMYFCGLNTLAVPPIHLHPINTSITHWEYHVPAGSEAYRPIRWRLWRYNDAVHLLDLNMAGKE